MAKKIIGKCFICKKELTKHDLTFKEEGQKYPTAIHNEKWPGDGLCCTEHPGVIKDYKRTKK
jgi:hypothetical protein